MRTQMKEKKSGVAIMSQEEIEALLEAADEVVDEDDLPQLPNIADHMVVEIIEYRADVIINGIKAKRTSPNRMKEIIKSVNTNIIKGIKFYYFDVLTGECDVDIGVKIGDRYYAVNGATTFQQLLVLKVEAIRAGLEVEEEFSMLILNNSIGVYSYGVAVKSQVIWKDKE